MGDTSAFVFLNDIRTLAELVEDPITTVLSGTAKVADTFGENWARFWDYPVERYPAAWSMHGKKAGILRNIEMLNANPSHAVEFPGGKGTAHMNSLLKGRGITVWKYDGG